MNRREFIKTIGAVSLIPVMPVVASTPDIKTWFSQNFDCHYGEPGSRVSDALIGDEYIYKTFAMGVLDSTEYEAEKRLSQFFIEKFTPLAKGRPKLWWRVEPQFADISHTEWGDTWMTAEQIEDHGKPTQIPQNVEYDFETNTYKYVLQKHQLYRLRFRLAIPSKDKQLISFAKNEGSEIGKI